MEKEKGKEKQKNNKARKVLILVIIILLLVSSGIGLALIGLINSQPPRYRYAYTSIHAQSSQEQVNLSDNTTRI